VCVCVGVCVCVCVCVRVCVCVCVCRPLWQLNYTCCVYVCTVTYTQHVYIYMSTPPRCLRNGGHVVFPLCCCVHGPAVSQFSALHWVLAALNVHNNINICMNEYMHIYTYIHTYMSYVCIYTCKYVCLCTCV